MKKLVLLLSLLAVLQSSFATIFTVNSLAATNTGSGTSGTLRYCMNIATITPGGPHTINFSVAGTIAIGMDANALPDITSTGLLINATTAPGFVDGPVVTVDYAGTSSVDGLTINAQTVSVLGLDITNVPGTGISVSSTAHGFDIGWCVVRNSGGYGISINGCNSGSVHDSWIGVDQTGMICGMNQYDGIDIQGGGSHHILDNHIACNGMNGIQMGSSTSNNVIYGNIIGPLEGTCNFNGYRGVDVEGGSQNNIIGGTGVGEGNKISGNEYYGIEVKEPGSTGNIISGNSMSCNVYSGIDVNSGGNNDLAAPVITTANATTVSGTANMNATIEIFRAQDPATFGCPSTPLAQGADFLGVTTANGSGNWTFTGTFDGFLVATQHTLVDGSSAFSNAMNTGVTPTWVNECAGPFIPSPTGSAPTADFSATPSTICVGECIQFEDLSSDAPTSWSWTFTGGSPAASASQDPLVCYAAPGVYNVTLDATNANGTGSITLSITVLPLPTVTILQNGSELVATPGHVSYEWYLDGVLLPGETNDTLVITTNGSYTCWVEGLNGCTSTSPVFSVTDMGLDNKGFAAIRLYPNPASTSVSLDLGDLAANFERLIITDLAGNVVMVLETGHDPVQTIDVSGFAQGVYFLQLTGDENHVIKFAKN